VTTEQLTVLVTGASSGIGQATAAEFARRGHTVFAAARRMSPPAPNLHPISLDVTDPESIQAGWATIQALTAGRGVDILVNSAGFVLARPVEELTDDELRRQFETNVFGLVAMARTVLPGMRERRAGRIITISSLVGRFTFPGMGAYCATKYAVESLSDAMRQELKGFGIDVIIIEPGSVATNLADAADGQRSDASPTNTSPYASLIRNGEKYFAEEIAKAMPAERVAKAIAKAAQHRRPRTRYVIPANKRLLLALLTGLPDRLADRAMLNTLGLANERPS
jgi:NAD(P)-dependent dehydrogenase (short-subunit alcohol dehydrogenase family)